MAGIRHWLQFMEAAYGSEAIPFPPQLNAVIQWSNTFRCVGTFCNYLGYLRSTCYALAVDAPPAGHPALKRAMCAIVKRQLFTTRSRCPIHVACHTCLQAPQAKDVHSAVHAAEHDGRGIAAERRRRACNALVNGLHLPPPLAVRSPMHVCHVGRAWARR